MGGAANVTPNFSAPTDALSQQLLQSAYGAGKSALEGRNANAMWQAEHPFESYMANIPGMQKLANQEATLNAANSAILEKSTNPGAYEMRQALPKALAADLAQTSGGTAGNAYKQQQLANLFGTGLQNSTIGNSALFDANTIQGKALRSQAEQAAQSYLAQNQAPVAGLDPGQLVAAQQASQAGAIQNKNQFLGAHQQNWQNYQQALYNAAAQNAASQNAITGSYIGAAGNLAGSAIGAGYGGGYGRSYQNPYGTSSTAFTNTGQPTD